MDVNAGASGGPVTAANVDLTNCDRELVQYSGAVQPHGILVALTEPDLRVVQISVNAPALFGSSVESLLSSTADDLFGAEQADTLRGKLSRAPLDRGPACLFRATFPENRFWNVFGHRIDGLVLLELEAASLSPADTSALYSELRGAVDRLQATSSLDEFLDLAVNEIRAFTGFDRVMAYKFLEDGAGRVSAESVADGFEPYLGLHYPASDIPQPARRLFTMSWLRHLPDVGYTPVPITPPNNPLTNGPLDLSYAFTRSLSVMYTGYLKNMGASSTMVITLMKKGELWGLISCMGHSRPVYVPYEVRMACEFLAHMVSLLMDTKEEIGNYRYKLRLAETWDQLFKQMGQAKDYVDGLTEGPVTILSSMDAAGGAIVLDRQVHLLGNTPGEEAVLALTRWIDQQQQSVFATDRLPSLYPAAGVFSDKAAGVLAVRLARSNSDMILWFRPELAQTVNWAGNPEKPVEAVVEQGEIRISPRRSFALWKESVNGRSAPWQSWEVDAAAELRRTIVEVIIQRSQELTRINRELEKSNTELDSFAYVASHDLKEPLRGIGSYSGLLLRNYYDQLDEKGKERLVAIQHLTRRMDSLIDSLLEYSRVGRMDLARKPVDMEQLVAGVVESLRPGWLGELVEIRIEGTLPAATCDHIRVSEVLQNLISNAVKYNDKPQRRIEIGCHQHVDPPIYYVRDNGIGIDKKNTEDIFQIFRRLHARDEYGGGTGVGLTISRRIVERHGGSMWIESQPGEGSTFYFTLAPKASAVAT